MDIAKDVRLFQEKMGYGFSNKPTHLYDSAVIMRGGHLMEEVTEFMRAAYNADIAGTADALIDLIYFAVGTLNMIGVPFDKAWEIVQEANMRKVPQASDRDRNDAAKPDGWRDPKVALNDLINELRRG
jgi:predicted HAD superfamily Cof-like phosphohydrolase